MNYASALLKKRDTKKEIRETIMGLPIAFFLLGVFISFLYVVSSPYIKSPFVLAVVFIVPSISTLLGMRSLFSRLFKQIDNL